MDCEVLAEMLVDQTELLFRHGPHKLIGKNARGLARSKAPLLPSDLSEQSHASTARIAVVLNTLEKKGLISRAIDPTDRRRILVSLTNVGQEYVAVVRTQLREDMKHLLEELGEQDAREYLRITKRILQISQEEFEERNRSVG